MQRPAAPAKLTILGLTLAAGERLTQDAINDYTKKTGVQVELIPTLGNSSEQMALVRKQLERRSVTPDVYVIDLIWPGTLHEHLLDLTPNLTEETRKHLPALLESGTIGGRVVSLPFYMNAGTLYYRADLLKAYGYSSPPRTWEQLTRIAMQVQLGERRKGRKDFWGYVWQGADYEGLTCNALEWQASFGGGRIIEPDGSISVNNRPTADAMKTATGWVGSISPSSVLAYTEADTQNVFRSGNAAFMRYWTSGFQSTLESMTPGSVGIAALPSGPAGHAQTIGGFHLAVSRYSQHPREATELILYLTGAEVQARRAILRGALPTYSHVYHRSDLIAAIPQARTLLEAGTNGPVLRPSGVAGNKYAEVSNAYHQTVHQILARTLPVEAGLTALENKLLNVMGTTRD